MIIDVNILIPCFNEEEALPNLFVKLAELNEKCISKYKLNFIFIDDGSVDNTFNILSTHEFSKKYVTVRHPINKNLGAAIKTGIKKMPKCTYVVFLDSDCTYDPMIIFSLLEKLEQGADIATVSPYHPQGKVEGVPKWRLLLSNALSNIYRLLLGLNLYTYTAMVRAHRYQIVNSITSKRNDFTFFTDSLIIAVSRNLEIVEIPAILSQRKYGVSKMRTINTIFSHLNLIYHYILSRFIK